MKNNKIFLEKLIKGTEEGTIIWKVSHEKKHNPWSGEQNLIRWKGEKKITNDKYIYFVLKHDKYYIEESEITVYFINEKNKTSDIIFHLKPGIWTFGINKLMKNLTNLIINKNKPAKEVQKSKSITPQVADYEFEGPLKSKWDEEDDDDTNNLIPQMIKEKKYPANQITNFDIANKNLTNLYGIEKLKSLSYLNCSHNRLKDIVEVENLTNLRHIFCHYNQLTSLKGIKNLVNLSELYCNNNKLNNIDEIINLNKLVVIWCFENNLTDAYKKWLKAFCERKNIELKA